MSLMDSQGRLFGKINLIDAGVYGVLLLGVLGIIAVQSGWHTTSGEVIKGEAEIQYTFMMRNAKVLDPNLFKVGDTLSMTIRNQPRGKVTITDVKVSPKMAVVEVGSNYKVIPDPTEKNGYDFLITVKDKATVTDDGYVTEGVKVKTGSNIDVEGFGYRMPALIVDVRERAKS